MSRSAPRGATLRSLRRFIQPGTVKQSLTTQPKPVEPTDLEREFASIWFCLGGTPVAWDETMVKPGCLRWQVRFDPTAGFRADFSIVEAHILVDLQGGSENGKGWHQQRDRYIEDCVKLNLASRTGWRMFHLTGSMVRDEPGKHIGPIIELAREATRAI